MAHALPSAGSAWHQGALDTDSGVFSPVFLLPPQSLLTGEIMDGTRFWGLAQCLSWAVLQRRLWAASCSLFGLFFLFFRQKREGMISVWVFFH